MERVEHQSEPGEGWRNLSAVLDHNWTIQSVDLIREDGVRLIIEDWQARISHPIKVMRFMEDTGHVLPGSFVMLIDGSRVEFREFIEEDGETWVGWETWKVDRVIFDESQWDRMDREATLEKERQEDRRIHEWREDKRAREA
jgi:hypothetical protein